MARTADETVVTVTTPQADPEPAAEPGSAVVEGAAVTAGYAEAKAEVAREEAADAQQAAEEAQRTAEAAFEEIRWRDEWQDEVRRIMQDRIDDLEQRLVRAEAVAAACAAMALEEAETTEPEPVLEVAPPPVKDKPERRGGLWRTFLLTER